ncbi:MAG: DNA mismatch repair endonuclease MutL [Bacteroidales bacterium]|jgi:DNA mismatch repair protein MutL|nr:DNA mismatch repair endonuclease MutL [Bacteroidales bacterium]
MSNYIKLLPDSVANQIAAGEVIQRPASAVKELLENAVDAGAAEVELIIKDAGKTLIQVIDNGCGMSAMDARMCFERHATSKISSADDLFAIRTMGFRGEALASIAAIAQVEMKTRPAEDEIGTCLQIEGSKVISQEPCQCSSGTNLIIKNLFFNVPARRNFLKSNTAETRHIIEEFIRVAVIQPSVAFSMIHNDKVVFKLPKGGLKSRIVGLFGTNYNEKLLPVEQRTEILTIKGFIGKPEYARKTRGEQYFFVNKRFIKHPYLHHAVNNAFTELIPVDSFPSYFLNIDIDPKEIDINIHPTKTEINFRDAKYVYAVMQAAVKQSIGKYSLTPTIDFEIDPAIELALGNLPKEGLKQPKIHFDPDYNPFKQKRSEGFRSEIPIKKEKQDWNEFYQHHLPEEKNTGETEESEKAHDTGLDLIHEKERLKFFQIQNTFITSNVRSGLMVIDQHKAHERILYEYYFKKLKGATHGSQQMLFPQNIRLSPGDAEIVRELKSDLLKLGYMLDSVGKNGFVINGIPADLQENDSVVVLERIIENHKKHLKDINYDKSVNLARSMAVNLAVKPGTRLQEKEMAEIFDSLFACQAPETALDGSRTLAIIPLNDIEHYLKEKKK